MVLNGVEKSRLDSGGTAWKRPTVAIIGGGFTGAAIAFHLAQRADDVPCDILVFEPRQAIGKGLAYDTSDPTHRINVPAARMSLLPDDLDHFSRWIERNNAVADDPTALRADGSIFPRRQVFGHYVHTHLRPLLETGIVRHVRSRITGVAKAAIGWRLADSEGYHVAADIVVIATTHPAPASPARLAAALAGHPRFIEDATKPGALDPIRPDDRVLVVGNGLTAADVIASLDERGHRGHVLALSRRGLRSRGHAAFAQDPFGDFVSPPPRSALDLLVRVRATIRDAEAQGLSWHAVLDQVRSQGRLIWQSLPIEERRRIVRHLRVFWDVHRFRIAPQVEQALDQGLQEGRLDIAAASIVAARRTGDVMEVTICHRGRAAEALLFDAVVITTGPAHGNILGSEPWLAGLAEAGHLLMDPTGLGLACNERGEALDRAGKEQPTLIIAGPLARGSFGELMGLPQVSEYAAFVAERILEQCGAQRSSFADAERVAGSEG